MACQNRTRCCTRPGPCSAWAMTGVHATAVNFCFLQSCRGARVPLVPVLPVAQAVMGRHVARQARLCCPKGPSHNTKPMPCNRAGYYPCGALSTRMPQRRSFWRLAEDCCCCPGLAAAQPDLQKAQQSHSPYAGTTAAPMMLGPTVGPAYLANKTLQ